MDKNMEKKKKIKRSFEFEVRGLVLVRKGDYTIKVQPLHVTKEVSRQILEIVGLD